MTYNAAISACEKEGFWGGGRPPKSFLTKGINKYISKIAKHITKMQAIKTTQTNTK